MARPVKAAGRVKRSLVVRIKWLIDPDHEPGGCRRRDPDRRSSALKARDHIGCLVSYFDKTRVTSGTRATTESPARKQLPEVVTRLRTVYSAQTRMHANGILLTEELSANGWPLILMSASLGSKLGVGHAHSKADISIETRGCITAAIYEFPNITVSFDLLAPAANVGHAPAPPSSPTPPDPRICTAETAVCVFSCFF